MTNLDAYLDRLSEAMTYWGNEKQESAKKYLELQSLGQKLALHPTPEWLAKQMATSSNYEVECSKCLTYLQHTYSAAKCGNIE